VRTLKRIQSLILLSLSVCASGCGTRVVYVRDGQPVRLAGPVKVKVWVPGKDGVPVKSDNEVGIPEGWYALPDPGPR
jgi:hypothetical protein